MYWTNAFKSAGPTENAPYPLCQANFANVGDCVLSHFDDEAFNSATNFATFALRDSRIARCTWSATPPTR